MSTFPKLPGERRDTTTPSRDKPAASEAVRFLGSWKMLLLVCGVLLLLAAAFSVAMTSQLAGDYVSGSDPLDAVQFRMTPLPVAGADWKGHHSLGHSYFRWGSGGDLVLHGGLLIEITNLGRSSINASTFGVPGWRLSRVRDAGGEVYELRPGPGVSHEVLRLERFPSGSLQPINDARNDRDFAAMAQAAADLIALAPDSPLPRHWHLQALLADGQIAEAENRFLEWEPMLESDPLGRGPVFAEMFRYELVKAAPEYDEDRSRYDALFAYTGLPTGPPSSARATYDEALGYLRESAGRNMVRPSQTRRYMPSFLDLQVQTKVGRIEAIFAAVRGDHDAAHELLMGLIALGHADRPSYSPIEGLIDIALRAITIAGFVDYYVKGEHSAARLEDRWPDIITMWEKAGEPVDYVSWTRPLGATTGMNTLEADARAGVTATQAQLFVAGYRLRHYRTATGEWPTVDSNNFDDRNLLLTAELPTRDWFGATETATLRWATDGDGLVLWSLGPDEDDDLAAVMYDPTNGTTSNGDLELRLTPEPRYDWPQSPDYLYADYDDFDRRYPGGELPYDPFSNGSRVPLRLARDHSHRVWSFGPNADQGRNLPPFAGRTFQPHYDPTNGTTSEGDLWMELPLSPDAQLPPAVTPGPTWSSAAGPFGSPPGYVNPFAAPSSAADTGTNPFAVPVAPTPDPLVPTGAAPVISPNSPFASPTVTPTPFTAPTSTPAAPDSPSQVP